MAMALSLQISLENLSNVFADLSGNGTAQGSGFIYDKKGHIVTNNHVVPDTSNTANKLVDVANKL
jgi:S1-C subfamily serine protease